ncbi:hypothetical protein STEG23_027921 [Scotinomys teguina]
MSESDSKEKGNLKEERPKSSKASSKLHTKVEKEKETDQGKTKQKPSGLYPVLDEFADLTLSDSAEDELDSEEKEDLEEAAAAYEQKRYSPENTEPPPYYPPKAKLPGTPSVPVASNAHFIKSSVWGQLATAFPVFEDPTTHNRYHEAVGYKQLKDLAEAVRTYGVSATFTKIVVALLLPFLLSIMYSQIHDINDNHYPKDNLLLFITHHPVIFPKVTAMEPLKGAIEIYTDGSKSGVGAYMLQGQDPVQFRFQPNTPQIVECQIVYEVFKRFHEPFNLLSDSHYVVNAVRGLETSAFIKESSLVHDILRDICVLIRDRTAPLFIGHIRAHTLLPDPMTAANDLADKTTRAFAAVELDSISMAKQFHRLYQVPAHTLCLKFKIS